MKIHLLELKPADLPDHMIEAWAGCLHWAISDPEILNVFREETGNTWRPGKTAIERMIDEACGADEAFLTAFVQWVNTTIWGPME